MFRRAARLREKAEFFVFPHVFPLRDAISPGKAYATYRLLSLRPFL
jgi:hypothetical protein